MRKQYEQLKPENRATVILMNLEGSSFRSMSIAALLSLPNPEKPSWADALGDGSGDYGYDLYDFDNLVFQTARDYRSLDDAKSAAIMAVATLEA